MPPIKPGLTALLVDDHALFRHSLALLLEHKLAFSQVLQAASWQDALPLLQEFTPDCLFLDYHLPDDDPLTQALAYKERAPHTKLLFLTGTQSACILSQLVASFADGVLHKELAPTDLEAALEQIQSGRKAISPQVLEKIDPLAEQLTPREFQLLSLLARGQVPKQIAQVMDISVRTVEKHKENLFKKTDTQNLAQLIELAYKWELLDIKAGV